MGAALDSEFERLGLLRPGEVARRLHLDVDVLYQQMRLGRVKMARFPWGAGGYKVGMSVEATLEMHDRMWPAHVRVVTGQYGCQDSRAATSADRDVSTRDGAS